jgi:hypothetical protein
MVIGSNVSAAGKSLKVGTAKVNITPTVPIPMSGYGGRNDPFKGVHDSLYARTIVFSDGTNKAATVTCELVGLSNAFWEEVTTKIEQETGIKKDYILLSSIHTHSGPSTNVYGDGNTPEVAAYVENLKAKLIEGAKEANSRLVDAKIGVGKGECLMNMNRRAMDGKGNTSLGLNPYAPCDHEVGVIKIDDANNKPIALLVNWPCHAVVLGPRNYKLTNDWPGAAANYLEKALGGSAVAPIIIGASGDINPIYGPHIDFENNSSYAFGRCNLFCDFPESLCIRTAAYIIHPAFSKAVEGNARLIPVKGILVAIKYLCSIHSYNIPPYSTASPAALIPAAACYSCVLSCL